MRYAPFFPGDEVVTLIDYEGVPSGTVGIVESRWGGTSYAVRLPDGTFRWLASSEFGSSDPAKDFSLKEGDMGNVTSDEHHHNFAKVGDAFKVYKVLYDVDHYGVKINNDIKWFGGFVLAKDI